MRPAATLAVVALLAACAIPAGGNGAPAAPAPAPAAAPAPLPAGSPILGIGSRETAALTPPAEAGASRSALSGCLTAASESEGARFPAPPVSRSPVSPVTVTAVPGGVLVVHDLTHACCLQGRVTSRIAGSVAVVRETLTGTPCRCMCGSTLRTAVGLPPGRWTVEVETEIGGEVKRVSSTPAEVK